MNGEQILCVDCDQLLADEKASERHHKQLKHHVVHMPMSEKKRGKR